MDDMRERLSSRVFPGLYRPLTSDDLSEALRASTFKHLGYEFGLRNWREVHSHFTRRFIPCPPETSQASAFCAQRGHSDRTDALRYGSAEDHPIGAPYQDMKAQLKASRLWQDLTGSWFLFVSTVFD